MLNPTDRAGRAELDALSTAVLGSGIVRGLLDAIPCPIAVLNRQRQILVANRAFRRLAAQPDGEELLGLRIGEALSCTRAMGNPGGCGTSKGCRSCGSLQAVAAAASGHPRAAESTLKRDADAGADWTDVGITCVPIAIEGHDLILLTAQDLFDRKRRQALERIFFHDILNKIGGIQGLGSLLETGAADRETSELAGMVRSMAAELVEDIDAQRSVGAAENSTLRTNPEELDSFQVVDATLRMYLNHVAAAGRTLIASPAAGHVRFRSDRKLLVRVLGNMVKNGLEASRPGDSVILGCDPVPDGVRFWVHNPGVMSADAQLRVFQRSYSTKGAGRGLGTYSMKLITEQYLRGKIGFESTSATGTTFHATLPVAPAA